MKRLLCMRHAVMVKILCKSSSSAVIETTSQLKKNKLWEAAYSPDPAS